jgi:hypothetical protein
MANRAKGKRYPVEISAVAWLDLLGYGSMLRSVRFDPSHPKAHAAVERLRVFQRLAASVATRHVQAMIVNDGVAYVRQLSPRGRSVTYDFLMRAYDAFVKINATDRGDDHPGARMIISVGPRLRIGGVVRPRSGHLQSILDRLSSNRISVGQAVREAFRSTPMTGSVAELQANFAFTKAYLADQAGSSAGFTGPHCFVDTTLLYSPIPGWLQFDSTIEWATQGLGGSFVRVKSIDSEMAGREHQAGIRDAAEIARALNIAY